MLSVACNALDIGWVSHARDEQGEEGEKEGKETQRDRQTYTHADRERERGSEEAGDVWAQSK